MKRFTRSWALGLWAALGWLCGLATPLKAQSIWLAGEALTPADVVPVLTEAELRVMPTQCWLVGNWSPAWREALLKAGWQPVDDPAEAQCWLIGAGLTADQRAELAPRLSAWMEAESDFCLVARGDALRWLSGPAVIVGGGWPESFLSPTLPAREDGTLTSTGPLRWAPSPWPQLELGLIDTHITQPDRLARWWRAALSYPESPSWGLSSDALVQVHWGRRQDWEVHQGILSLIDLSTARVQSRVTEAGPPLWQVENANWHWLQAGDAFSWPNPRVRLSETSGMLPSDQSDVDRPTYQGLWDAPEFALRGLPNYQLFAAAQWALASSQGQSHLKSALDDTWQLRLGLYRRYNQQSGVLLHEHGGMTIWNLNVNLYVEPIPPAPAR